MNNRNPPIVQPQSKTVEVAYLVKKCFLLQAVPRYHESHLVVFKSG